MTDAGYVWIEIKTSCDELASVRARAQGATSMHQFFFEPWHPEGVVVRVLNPPEGLHGDEWNATPDEQLYGDWWREVATFFEAGSSLLPYVESDEWRQHKLVHCLLNSWGMDPSDELRFGLRLVRERARILWHFKIWHSRALRKFHARCPWS